MIKLGGNTDILLGLRNQTNLSAHELSQKMINIPLEKSYDEWLQEMKNLQDEFQSNYNFFFGGLMVIYLSLCVPWDQAYAFAEFFIGGA